MKTKLTLIFILIFAFLLSCGKYKMLKPKPEVLALEADYTRILNKDKYFELKNGKKYYMEFPAVQQDNFYLVLKVASVDAIGSHLTRQFTKGKGDVKMRDESPATDDLLVYKLDRTVSTYTWVIENVSRDMGLDLDYRYMPIWRFRFESKSAEFQGILAQNTVDRHLYTSLGDGTSTSSIQFDRELSELRQKNARLRDIQGELDDIEAIFPPGIKNSDDRAYLDYVDLKSELASELDFHKDYETTLNFFKKERESRGSMQDFEASLDDFNAFFDGQNRYPENVRREARRAISERLSAAGPYYADKIRKKRDTRPLNFPIDKIEKLYRASDRQPDSQFAEVAKFTRAYNKNARALATTRQRLSDLMRRIETSGQSWPSNSFYRNLTSDLDQLMSGLPNAYGNPYGRFSSTEAVRRLNDEAQAVNRQVSNTQRDFEQAGQIVAQINRLRDQGDFTGITRLLKANNHLGFLMKQYGDIDQRSLDGQAKAIENAYNNRQWALAEQRLRTLYEDRNFINYNGIRSQKERIQRQYENKLVAAIEKESKDRINVFIEDNKSTTANVDGLYSDPAFSPVHTMTFSAGGPRMVEQYNKKVQDYLDGLKYDRFPKLAIQTIYRDFVSNIRNGGVEKAKAVSAHGRYYKGSDKKTKNLVAECDPMVPKWITKAKNYRKVYVLPTNATQQSSNQYVFKMNIQIPSDAAFPVFDINVKLPREVANSAGSQKWYEKITMNGNLLKNEGSFTISAPTQNNNYECQITPVQMKKTGNNILEVTFNHDAFKVLEVSVMAQRPIIKKN